MSTYIIYVCFQFHYVDVGSSVPFHAVTVKCSLLAAFPRCSINLVHVFLNTNISPFKTLVSFRVLKLFGIRDSPD